MLLCLEDTEDTESPEAVLPPGAGNSECVGCSGEIISIAS